GLPKSLATACRNRHGSWVSSQWCSRRTFIAAAALGLVGTAFGGPLVRSSAAPLAVAGRRPRYLVLIELSGGPDAILTLDPKTRSEVASWVDNPVARDNVTSGNVSLGGNFAGLAPWASKMAILRGVRVESVNHPGGEWQLLRMRRRVTQSVP